MAQPVITRMTKEVRMLQAEPPPGVWAAPKGDKLTELEAQLRVRGLQPTSGMHRLS